ncbi:MAG: PD40 domain-containing protein [Kiritimatiellae bacterium]|nr:PD40 domain-containing protein [Kiritimatiellia bacterium]
MRFFTVGFAVLFAALAARGETVVDVEGVGAGRMQVSIDVSGSPAFKSSLRRNLELSGRFEVVAKGAIAVTGAVGGEIKVVGKGKVLALSSSAADDKAARMEARRLADKMCEALADQKGFAMDRIAFVSREAKGTSELCVTYPDGYDIMRLTSDGGTVVGPRWKNRDSIFYTGIRGAGPQVFEYDVAGQKRKLKWSFRGLTTGAAVSPDGNRVAIILSMHGNPELYVIDMAAGSWRRLTTTQNASEGQPCWSPDGRKIVYVSDETRHPQLYVIDVATKEKRRVTSIGSQNVDPDWGLDGRIAYITKRGGQGQIAVLDPKTGDKSAQLVGAPGSWEHPSWARDGRHVVAGRDKALFVVDTATDNPAEPKIVFRAQGNWITPCWSK